MTEMSDRQNVISGLQYTVEMFLFDPATGYSKDPDDLNAADRITFDACIGAIALLKEQEARVMTLDEVKAFDWDYCYLEEERLPGKEYRKICGDYALTCVTWPSIASMRILHGDDSYGKKWRCWSAKPTDEQRKAVKWDA